MIILFSSKIIQKSAEPRKKMGVLRLSLLLALFSVFMRDASALKCVSCIHLGFSPSPPSGVPNIYVNKHCKDYHPITMADNYDNCPDDTDQHTYVCGLVQGTYTFDVPTVGITTVDSVLRRCLVKPQGLATNSTKVCLKNDNLDKAVNDVSLIGATEEFGDMTHFDGEVCYCHGTRCNAAPGMERTASTLMTLVLGSLSLMIYYWSN